MAQLGNSSGGFQFRSQANRSYASKFVASESFTPSKFLVNWSESWGASGPMEIAIYSDNAGSPGTKIWSQTETYAYPHNGWEEFTMTSPPALTNGTTYWLCVNTVNSGGVHWVNYQMASVTGEQVVYWDEATGTWGTNPVVTQQAANRQLSIYVTNLSVVTKSHTTSAYIKKINNDKTHTTNALIKKVNNDKTHTTDAFLQQVVGLPVWTSPANHATDQLPDEPLVFTIPQAEGLLHFEMQIDTVNTFDSGDLQTIRSWEDQTNWEYYDGDSWEALPAEGIDPDTYAGNEVRYTPSGLTENTYYRRVRGRIVVS